MVVSDGSQGSELLAGQAVIVVGSTQGIGRAVAEALSAHGAAVVVNGRDGEAAAAVAASICAGRSDGASPRPEPSAPAAGEATPAPARAAIAVGGSAADPDVARSMLDRAVEEWGGVEALVVCAGTAEPQGSSILDITTADFDALIDTHLRTTFQACRVVAPHLVERGGGAIVTTSSHAFTGTYGGTGYPAGKGAVTSLTYALAAELAEHGVRVNAVCPGATTRLSTGDDYLEHIDELHARGLLDDATRHGSLDPGPPDYVAQLYAYLVSALSDGVTGEVFAGAGGYLGRFARPEAELVTWRDHHTNPPWTVEEMADLLGGPGAR